MFFAKKLQIKKGIMSNIEIVAEATAVETAPCFRGAASLADILGPCPKDHVGSFSTEVVGEGSYIENLHIPRGFNPRGLKIEKRIGSRPR